MSEQQPWESYPEQSAKAYDVPTLTVLGAFKGGKLVRVEWSKDPRPVSLSDRTLQACQVLGIVLVDNPDDYLFTGEMI